jgi:hypothetical protein
METQERIKHFEKEERERIEAFAKELKNVLQLFDPEKIPTRNTSVYSRETLRTYLKNPATENNNKNLRKLSNYLYTISHVYRRMINYKAHQINCKVWNAYPIVSLIEDNDEEAILKEYERTVNIVTNMHMETQIYKLMLQAWKNGITYGYVYGDPEKDGSFYIHLLDPDYCKVSCASFDSGVLGFLFDMSFFNGNEEQLQYYDKEFERLYNEFKKDNVRWKQLPIERTICIKIDPDNLDYAIPPMSGLLESIISITDLQAAQDEIDSLQNYKLVWGKLDTIQGTSNPDDFAVNLDLALAFMKKLGAELPNNVSFGLSPMDLDIIDFDTNNTGDTNILSKAYSNLIESNGSIVLNSNKITNSTAFKMAMRVECQDAMAPVTQINAWLRSYLKYNHKIESIEVEYSDISPYFMDDEIEKYTKLAGLSLPVKMELASMVRANPRKSIGIDFLERQLLGLGTTRWINPLVSANTQSALPGEEGRPASPESALGDEGVASRDQNKNEN